MGDGCRAARWSGDVGLFLRVLTLAALALPAHLGPGLGAAEPGREDAATLQRVHGMPEEVRSLRADIEGELSTLETLSRDLEGYARQYPTTRDFDKLAAARQPAHVEAAEKAARIPEMLNRLDTLCAALQVRMALVLLDRGIFAKSTVPERKIKKVAGDYFLNSPEVRGGIQEFYEMRDDFPRKASARLAAARKIVDAEEAAFSRALEARESLKQMRLLTALGAATALLLALGVIGWRRRSGRS